MSPRRDSPALSRRDFVVLTTTAAGASILAACERDARMLAPDFAAGGQPVTRYPLHVPPTVSPAGLVLDARAGVADLGDGRPAAVWAYNGWFPAPTIRASRGDLATIQLSNGLPQKTITHWHGMIVDDVNDGHPRFAVAPGGSRSGMRVSRAPEDGRRSGRSLARLGLDQQP